MLRGRLNTRLGPESWRPVDFLIIGQGLAGSILGFLLEQHQQEVMIVDPGRTDSASRIAAGIVNPIAGQRLVKHPRAEICLARARALYATLGNFFRQTFYFERPMIRLFASERERRLWSERKAAPAYRAYLGDPFFAREFWPAPANRHGGFRQRGSGYLDTQRFLDAIRNHFESQGRLVETEFSWQAIEPKNTPLLWKGLRVKCVIGCEGHAAADNPYFSWLPFQCSKGELLTLKSTVDLPDAIVNQGKWLLPLNPRVIKCGATYEWNALDRVPSAPARAELCTAARQLLTGDADFRVLAQHAGLRPGSLDKNPFAGIHPALPRLGLFNGFGSRGVLTIPYYAERFVEHLLHHEDLPREVDINRFRSRYEAG